MDEWIQNWDIQEQELDPVTEAVTSEPLVRSFIHYDSMSGTAISGTWMTYFSSSKHLHQEEPLTEECECQEVTMQVFCRPHIWAVLLE